ncbi:MAG: PKD domain-containing protein [Acidobacteria bacterium]|nr:PKD domain-containing protein [Acidobacteriota bacterium]
MSRIFSRILLAALTVVLVSCDKVPLTAPTGSTVTLNINTTSLPLNGSADITAVVVEAAGTPPQNGTLVTFTSTLGSIEPREARTTNGLAAVTYRAGSTSGTARIGAFSGSASAEAVELQIGGAAAVSPGSAITDANGEARTTVTAFGAATVSARAGGATATIELQAAAVTLAVSTTTPEVGVPVGFTIAPVGTVSLREVIVDFGDGTPRQNLGPVTAQRAVSHVYAQRGTYTVTADAVNAQGIRSVASVIVTVNDRAPVAVGLTAAPNPASLATTQGLVTLTATATPPAGSAIRAVYWDFGDGTAGVASTQLQIQHRYGATGTFTASVLVVTTDGREGSASTSVRITP